MADCNDLLLSLLLLLSLSLLSILLLLFLSVWSLSLLLLVMLRAIVAFRDVTSDS